MSSRAAAAANNNVDYEEAEVDAGASAGEIAVAVAHQELDNDADEATDVTGQLKALREEMKRLNVIAEKQLRAATAGLLVHTSDNQFSITVTSSWYGTPHDFAANPARRTWSPPDPLCLKPNGMNDAEFKRLFPDNKALLHGVDIMMVESTMPFMVGVLSSCKKLPANASAGTSQKYHMIVRANATPTGQKVALAIGSGAVTQNKFLERYPGWTPDRIRREGHMQDTGNALVKWLGSHHPAQDWVASTLRQMYDGGNTQAGQDLKLVLDRTAVEDFVPLPTNFCNDCIEQCASDVDRIMPIVDLTELPVMSIQRPGLKFNEATEMQVRAADSLHALLRMTLPAMGTNGGYSTDAPLNGSKLLGGTGAGKKMAAAATGGADLGNPQHVLDHVLNAEYGLTVDVTYTFSSPVQFGKK